MRMRRARLLGPMHEQNGTFFWWGHDGTSGSDLRARQAAWTFLWRKLMYEMTVTGYKGAPKPALHVLRQPYE